MPALRGVDRALCKILSPLRKAACAIERGFKTLKSRLQAVASGEIDVICRLKPGLQRLGSLGALHQFDDLRFVDFDSEPGARW